jgi:hypothetical protein
VSERSARAAAVCDAALNRTYTGFFLLFSSTLWLIDAREKWSEFRYRWREIRASKRGERV